MAQENKGHDVVGINSLSLSLSLDIRLDVVYSKIYFVPPIQNGFIADWDQPDTEKSVWERERFERGREVWERDRERKKRESGKEIG